MPSVFSSWPGVLHGADPHYSSDRQYLYALADALKHEYKAIVDAGTCFADSFSGTL